MDQTTWMTFDREDQDDPLREGFSTLRLFNEEVLSPGRAFILRTHEDMVVVTYIHEGVIVYNGPSEGAGLMEPGHFQGIDVAADDRAHLFGAPMAHGSRIFQSGFAPGTGEVEPTSGKRLFTLAERKGILKLIASPDGKGTSLKIRQDVKMYSTLIQKGNHMAHELGADRGAWLHVVKGRVSLGGTRLQAGDGAGFSKERAVSFTAEEATEILLFDLAWKDAPAEALALH